MSNVFNIPETLGFEFLVPDPFEFFKLLARPAQTLPQGGQFLRLQTI